MKNSFAVTIIGTGNMGHHLVKVIDESAHFVNEIYSRDLQKANKLCGVTYDAKPTDSLDFGGSQSQIFILAVSDDAIESVVREIVLPEQAIIAHTAGSVSVEVLELSAAIHYGVFYPLQSVSKEKPVSFRDIPILVEAATANTREALLDLANSISTKVSLVDSAQRSRIHLAATIMNNFGNHLLKVAFDQVKLAGHTPELLYPLLQNTVDKAMQIGPDKSQTGPAVRGDVGTIRKHMEMLAEEPAISELYRLFTNQIGTIEEDGV